MSVVYLDSPASTPLDPRVVTTMREAVVGNPHATHALGIKAAYQIETARQQILALVGKGELIFTSGATEANAQAILGMALRELRRKGTRRKIVSCTTEHSSILELKRTLQLLGFAMQLVPVHRDGRVQLDALEQAMDRDTLMLSIMTVNNETGVTQDWQAIQARAGRSTIHTDAAQALGKTFTLPQCADLITLSAHKIHGPQGIGGLLIRRGPKPDALLRGGGQQKGLRAGTMPTALCMGFGACCAIVQQSGQTDQKHIRRLSQHLIAGIIEVWPLAQRVGQHCIDGIVCMHLPGVHARKLLDSMPDIAASMGSACDARSDRVSHVLRAMRVRDGYACLRLGISRMTTAADIEMLLERLASSYQRFQI